MMADEAIKESVRISHRGFETGPGYMRELAEMATKSQREAFDVVPKRIEENDGRHPKLWKKKLANETGLSRKCNSVRSASWPCAMVETAPTLGRATPTARVFMLSLKGQWDQQDR